MKIPIYCERRAREFDPSVLGLKERKPSDLGYFIGCFVLLILSWLLMGWLSGFLGIDSGILFLLIFPIGFFLFLWAWASLTEGKEPSPPTASNTCLNYRHEPPNCPFNYPDWCPYRNKR